MKHNMKIQINAEQPLDEVVKEVERLGFDRWDLVKNPKFIVCNRRGMTYQMVWNDLPRLSNYQLTTLQQLREMK